MIAGPGGCIIITPALRTEGEERERGREGKGADATTLF